MYVYKFIVCMCIWFIGDMVSVGCVCMLEKVVVVLFGVNVISVNFVIVILQVFYDLVCLLVGVVVIVICDCGF